MLEPRKIAKHFAAIALTTGLAMATQGVSGTPMLIQVSNNILGNLASSYIEKTEFRKLSAAITGTDPTQLNHDLQKLIAKSVRWTIKNIRLLYDKQLELDTAKKKELKEFTKSLEKNLTELEDIIINKKDSIYQLIDNPGDKAQALKDFQIPIDGFPIIHPANPFPQFFENVFQQNLQLCFVELLKKEENRPAYIAYQRAIYKKLDRGVSQVILQNENVLKSLTNLEEKLELKGNNDTWQNMRQEIGRTDLGKIQSSFDKLMMDQLNSLYEKTELLIDLTQELSKKVDDLTGLTIGMNRQLRENWLSKQKVWVFALLTIAGLVISFLLYQRNTAPFQMSMQLQNEAGLSIHPEFPKISSIAKLKIYFPEEIEERSISTTTAATFLNLSHDLKQQKIRVELLDRFWELSQDSVKVQKGSLVLDMRPNEYLGLVEGRISSGDGSELLLDAVVQIDDVQVKSDELGRFKWKVPIEQRRPLYELRISKPGFKTKELEYSAGYPIEIRLDNN